MMPWVDAVWVRALCLRRTLARTAGMLFLCGCSSSSTLPPSDQVVLYIDTDAPLPAGNPSARTALDSPPLFDRVRFDGKRGDGKACDCTREFDVTTELVRAGNASFGIFPGTLTGGGTVRVRLFLAAAQTQAEPTIESTIDVTVKLPAVAGAGVVERTVMLHTDDVGNPIGADQPIDTLPGPPTNSKVGTWPGARRVDCPGPPKDGEVCVPGGAYWMGNPDTGHWDTASGNRQRIVVLSPFYMDATEVTVAAFRAAKGTPSASWSGQIGCATNDYCTFTPSPGPYDAYPVNCVNWGEARQYCRSQGKDLPTEAQWEYVASGLEGRLYVWGEDGPHCQDAVLARAGFGVFGPFSGYCNPVSSTDTSCQGIYPPGGLGVGGPMVPGHAARDQLNIALPHWQGTVVDLVGNVGEAVLDAWQALTDACWARPGVYIDPVCATATGYVTQRGGDWTQTVVAGEAALRLPAIVDTYNAQIGFRCARAAQ